MSFFVPTRFVWRFGGRQVGAGWGPPCRRLAQLKSTTLSYFIADIQSQHNILSFASANGAAVRIEGQTVAVEGHYCMYCCLHFTQVHLCGSFTRWVETIPMAPVDGTPGVFAVVVHLPPG